MCYFPGLAMSLYVSYFFLVPKVAFITIPLRWTVCCSICLVPRSCVRSCYCNYTVTLKSFLLLSCTKWRFPCRSPLVPIQCYLVLSCTKSVLSCLYFSYIPCPGAILVICSPPSMDVGIDLQIFFYSCYSLTFEYSYYL